MSDFVSKLMLLSTLGVILPIFGGEGRRSRLPYLVEADQIEALGRVFATYELLPAKSGL